MTADKPQVIGRRGAAGVGVSSMVAAISGYVVLLIAARTLTIPQNSRFLVFWAVLFALYGVLGGLQSEVTRSTRARGTAGGGAHVLSFSLVIGLALSVVLVVSSPLWATRVFDANPATSVAVLAGAVLAMSGHVATAGASAGAGEWGTAARLVATEAVLRLVLVGGAAVAGWGLLGLETASAGAALSWLCLALFLPRLRWSWTLRADVSSREFLRRSGHAMAGATGTAALLVGFPLLLRVTTGQAEYAMAAPLILAVSMTRAPLMLPLGAYQGVAIAHFVDHPRDVRGLLMRLGAIVLGVAAVGAALAALVGPRLMVAFFGPGYEVTPQVLAGLTFAAGLLAVLTLTGSAVLARARHRSFAVGWAVASAASVAVLMLPMDLDARTVLALTCGPLVGVLVHLAALRTTATG